MSETIPCPQCAAQVPVPAVSGPTFRCWQCGTVFTSAGNVAMPGASPATATPSPGPTTEARELARRSLRAPALLLLATSVLGLAANLFQIGWLLTADRELATLTIPGTGVSVPLFRPDPSPRPFIVGAVFAVLNTVVLLGGLSMWQLRRYSLALTGSMLALFNCGLLCCVLSYPAGAWAVMVLRRPEVRGAFD